MSVSTRCIACGFGIWHPYAVARDRMFNRREPFYYQQCERCGLIRQHPRISLVRLKSHYPSSDYYAYKDEPSPGFFDRLRHYLLGRYYQPTLASSLLTLIIPNVPAIPSFVPGGRLLDVGCGTGDTILELKSLGWDVYGMDIDANAVKIAHKRGLGNVSYGSYQDIARFPDRFFDVIRLYHVIEHLDNPRLCLSIIRKKLKPGGELVVGTPNAGSVAAKVFGSYWYNLDAPRHIFLFTPKNLEKMLTATGFSVSSVGFCSAGGVLGSLQYLAREKLHRAGFELLSHSWLVMLVYPVEWLLDKCRLGDVFIISARKR